MCGIVGLLNLTHAFEPREARQLVDAMSKHVAHRGPDMDGLWSDGSNFCYFGHRRLSIIDLSEGGRQPMTDPSGRYAITYNGELYNYQDIRRDLEQKGIRFKTECDTEVLLAGFIVYGEKVFEKADGMFAVAIFDKKLRSLTLARDRAGEKPLYYINTGKVFAFASELQALTTIPDTHLSISEPALASYLMLRYVPAPLTILSNVNKLMPGHSMIVTESGETTEKRYFAFELHPAYGASQANFEKYCHVVEEALTQSMKRRLMSDVPLGVFLSAGVDSSLACALVTRRLGITPKTFTIGFENDSGSEHITARRISQHLGTDHREHIFSAADFDAVGSRIGSLMDEPNGDRSCVPTYLLSKFAREAVTVAISGDGGDELFCGYDRYFGLANAIPQNYWDTPLETISAYFNRFLPVFGSDATRSLFPDAWRFIERLLQNFAPLFQYPGRSVVQALRQMDFATYLPGAVLPKVDRMSMRCGLEVRTPFLSPNIFDLSSQLNTSYCSNGKFGKLALRQILGKYLPADIVTLPKRGFGMPASVFINNQDKLAAELRIAQERLSKSRFFGERKGLIPSLMKYAGQNINTSWAVIVLGQWLEAFPVGL